MMEFYQKETFVTNFERSKLQLYKKAQDVFHTKNKKIKTWIEEDAKDSLGRLMEDHMSLHTDSGFKGSRKWNRFYKGINKKTLLNGMD